MNKKKNQILIVAAESSSVLYAERLLEYFQKTSDQQNSLHFFGVGSQAMENLGFQRLGRSEDMAVTGFHEVLGKILLIWKVFHKILKEAKKRRPKVALLLDYPDFNLRLAKRMKKLGIPVVYYISPQIWAWRKSRIHTIKKRVDKMLVILPFEEQIYKDHHIPVEFIGHPLLDELEDRLFDKDYKLLKRSQFALKEDDIVLGLMPGSRDVEWNHHLKVQLEVAKKMSQNFPEVKIALLLSPNFKKEDVQKKLEKFKQTLPSSFLLIQDEPFKMIHLSDLILAAAGTATLMVGLMEKPMVIMYKTTFTSALILRNVVKAMPGLVSCFGLVNLILGKKVAPEFFQNEATPDALYSVLKDYITSPSKKKDFIKELKSLRERLGHKGATQKVAKALSPYLNCEPKTLI